MRDKLISFFGLLLLSFIVLKLSNTIEWSWLWVLSPLWIPLTILVLYATIEAWRKRNFVPCYNCKYGTPHITTNGLWYFCSNNFCFHSKDDRCKEGQQKD